MAALWPAGNGIEDKVWSEADIYGPTTRQNLEAKNMERALEAHITTVQALYDLYMEEFFLGHVDPKGLCAQAAQQLDWSSVQYLHVGAVAKHASHPSIPKGTENYGCIL